MSSKLIITLNLFKQVLRFGAVGSCAALCTYLMLHWQISVLHVQPLFANCVAVSLASIISFTGHKFITFKKKENTRKHLVRFYGLLLSSFLLNQCVFAFIFYGLHFSYHIAFLVASIFLPIYTFLLNKFWVFKSIPQLKLTNSK